MHIEIVVFYTVILIVGYQLKESCRNLLVCLNSAFCIVNDAIL